MIPIMQNKGFRNFIIKCVIYVVAVIVLIAVIGNFFSKTPLYKEYLEIPHEFFIEPPMVRIYLINALLFGLVAFIIRFHDRFKDIKYFRFARHQYLFLALSVLVLASHYLLKFIINRNVEYFLLHPMFWAVVKYGINVVFLITLGIGIFGRGLIKSVWDEYKRELAFFVIMTSAFYLLMRLVQNSWTIFSGAISRILYWIFSRFFSDVTYIAFVRTSPEGGGPLLGIGDFQAIIGKSCSGIDSFLLFTALYALIFIMDYKRLKRPLAVMLFFFGAIGMFLTNALRLLLLFIIGAYYDADLAVGLFHTNAGWILFIVYFFIFWSIVSRFIYVKREMPVMPVDGLGKGKDDDRMGRRRKHGKKG